MRQFIRVDITTNGKTKRAYIDIGRIVGWVERDGGGSTIDLEETTGFRAENLNVVQSPEELVVLLR